MLRRLLIPLGYCFSFALVFSVTAILVAYGNGYEYNFSSGKIIRTGIILAQTSPAGAVVKLDNKVVRKHTPYKVSLKAGTYSLSLNLSGYHPWSKSLAVVASQVTLAQYITLIPDNPQSLALDSRQQLVAQNISRDHRHLVYATSGADAGVYVLDLTTQDPKPLRIYTPKAATATSGVETLTGVTFSDDASHVLIASTVGATPTYRLIASSGGDSSDLTAQYGFDFTGLTFSGSNWQQLYWNSPDGLRRLDVGSASVSGVLATGVVQFITDTDHVLFVQTTAVGTVLAALDNDDHRQVLFQGLPVSPSYSLAAVSYRGQEQLAVVPSATGVGTVYGGIYGSNPVSKVIAHNVTTATLSPDGHLALFYSIGTADPAYEYDLEQSSVAGQTVIYTIPSTGVISQVTWYDDFHLLTTENNRLIWSDFDGTNPVDLGSSAPTMPGYASSDLHSIFSFQPMTNGGVRITQTIIHP